MTTNNCIEVRSNRAFGHEMTMLGSMDLGVFVYLDARTPEPFTYQQAKDILTKDCPKQELVVHQVRVASPRCGLCLWNEAVVVRSFNE